ncbi:hypothetical protein [Silvimonas sp.]|uniref:hypothetical protein n=1 Tax=Silvimonas sp. TaxID=2650811 RepID=UPI002847E374|nr:hypothetical protein [Silvimonas sp.]MDR3427732.1 hypothetical protein [Silvimonas sp.]
MTHQPELLVSVQNLFKALSEVVAFSLRPPQHAALISACASQGKLAAFSSTELKIKACSLNTLKTRAAQVLQAEGGFPSLNDLRCKINYREMKKREINGPELKTSRMAKIEKSLALEKERIKTLLYDLAAITEGFDESNKLALEIAQRSCSSELIEYSHFHLEKIRRKYIGPFIALGEAAKPHLKLVAVDKCNDIS